MSNRFDGLTLSSPLSGNVLSIDKSAFVFKPTFRNGIQEKNSLIYDVGIPKKKGIFGIQNINIQTWDMGQRDEQGKELEPLLNVRFSGKLLGHKEYLKGIGINNIEKVVSKINDSPGIKLDITKFIDNAQVNKCDCTKDLHLTRDWAFYLNSLSTLNLKNIWNRDITNLGRGSLVISGKSSSNSNRLIIYSKHRDLMKAYKRGDGFAQSMGVNTIMGLQNVLRFEQNIRSYRDMRKMFNVDKDRKLLDVLQSTENVNLNFFQKIRQSGEQMSLFQYSEEMKFIDLVRLKGMESIYKECHGDLQLINKLITKHSNSRHGHWERHFRNYATTISHEDDSNILNEIETLLSA